MTRRAVHIFIFIFSIMLSATVVSAQGPAQAFVSGERSARALELYNDGSQALDQGDWEAAVLKLGQGAELHGQKGDQSLYWKAYAENKLGRRQDALSSIAALRRQYPRS